MKVLLVTSWGTQGCGIEEHSKMLIESVQATDATIEIVPDSRALDPQACLTDGRELPDVVHINHHAALHSRWRPEHIAALQAAGVRVLATVHDTGVPNSDQCKDVCGAADWFVVHEPYDDLPAHGEYLRMGVPDWPTRVEEGVRAYGRPILGTVGFPFPWKCYDELCKVTAQVGWGLVLLAPTATDEQIATWQRLNPHTLVERTFLSRAAVIRRLACCDATAFTYVCHNTGQSGPIYLGLAARKPVIALSNCRQFRALYLDELGHAAIRWAESFDEVAWRLRKVPIQRVDALTVALAEQESWAKKGARYAAIYQELACAK